MFKSKTRSIVIPQSEHGRVAGMLAAHWGSDRFQKPPVPFESFVKGVTLHDRGYGLLDNAPLLEMPDADWMDITRRGFDYVSADPIADIIVRHHLLRLTKYNPVESRLPEIERMETALDEAIAASGIAPDVFQKIDRLMRLCDDIAFDFCFEQPRARKTEVYANFADDAATPLQHTLSEGGLITLTPWPFSIPEISGFIFGYEREGYPDRLETVIVPFRVVPFHVLAEEA
ncbi:MAG: DUF3891 family protein [bacterium]|nr:DUF3891 family protein [bacterium]